MQLQELDFEINHVQKVHRIIVLLKVIHVRDIEDRIYILRIDSLFHFEKLPLIKKKKKKIKDLFSFLSKF